MDEERLTKDEKKKIRQEEWKKELDAENKRKIRNKILTWGIGAAILAFAVWFLVTVVNQPSPADTTSSIKMPPLTTKDIQIGVPKAKIQLVEYADFQCPSCKAYYPIIKKLQIDFQGKMLFVYRFFPLFNIHQNALNSSDAAYAANSQGKFWEMHDMLFETQDTWATSTTARDIFLQDAAKLGLDIPEFQKDFNNPATEKFVKDQANAALDLGLQGTPTFFLNGKIIALPATYADFKTVLQNAAK